MTTRASPAILPRDLQTVPPPIQLVGRKAHALAQLLALKSRVPRFGILTVDAFDDHLAQDDVRRALEEAHERGLPDDASRTAVGEGLVRAVLKTQLPVAVRIAVHELVAAFADEDMLVVRASVVGEPLEASAQSGAFDASLGLKGKDAIVDAVHRLYALAFHPRTLTLRHQAGLLPLNGRIAVLVQRMVQSESSGVCVSLETALRDTAERAPRVLLSSTWGLAGGIGGKHGSNRIPCDHFRVERPALAADGVEDTARVHAELQRKTDALRFDDGALKGARMMPVADHLQKEPSLTQVQARMVAREALRLEAAFGKPQVMSFAFAGRLLHVLDTEPLLVPVARVESERVRTWDDRLLPAGLPEKVAPLTFSVWQRTAARGVERAGRILGVKGVLLEEVRPQMPRLIGLVSGRVYGNLEVLTALLDLLPFSDKARAALADATGQAELIPRKAPPPGFWQRQRQKLDEGRWIGQLEKIAEVTLESSERLVREARATLDKARATRPDAMDPDSLLDSFDELEDALSKIVAALAMSGLCAMLHRRELDDELQATELRRMPGVLCDLLGGDVPAEIADGPRRVLQLVSQARRMPLLSALLREHLGKEEALAQKLGLVDGHAGIDHDEVRWVAHEVMVIAEAPHASCTSNLALEQPRLHERPEGLLHLLCRLVDTDASPETLDELERAAIGRRKKAEYLMEQTFVAMGGLKGSNLKKRADKLLAELRQHSRDTAMQWMLFEELVVQLRYAATGLGERLFEHSMLDQPRDVFSLEVPEIAGLVRGTGVDADVRPLVASRKRAAVAEPVGLPRRVETRGLVATSLLSHEGEEEEILPVTSPGDTKDLQGRAASAGEVRDRAALIDGSPLSAEGPGAPRGVLVTKVATLRNLPLMLAGRGVVAERGTLYGPAVFLLRALGLPTLVDTPKATSVLRDGATVHLNAGRGLVRRGAVGEEVEVKSAVDPHVFAREAIISDPFGRARPRTPAGSMDDMPPPPLVRPAGSMDEFLMPPSGASLPPILAPQGLAPPAPRRVVAGDSGERGAPGPVHEDTNVDDRDILFVSTDADGEPDQGG